MSHADLSNLSTSQVTRSSKSFVFCKRTHCNHGPGLFSGLGTRELSTALGILTSAEPHSARIAPAVWH